MAAEIEDILAQHRAMVSVRDLWITRWQDIADYIHPRRAQFTGTTTPGAKRTSKLFDSTAINANEDLSSAMGGTLTSKANKWFTLRMRNEGLQEFDDTKKWLELCGLRMMAAFEQSNFYSEISEVFLDLPSFATACLLAEERPIGSGDTFEIAPTMDEEAGLNTFEGFVFRSYPLSEFVISEGVEGEVDTVFRSFSLTPVVAEKRWGKDALSEPVQKSLPEKTRYSPFKVLHAVYPRSEPKGEEKPWASVYIDHSASHIIAEGGYEEFPYMVPRWSKSSGEIYGRGPGLTALPDIKTLNKAEELQLKAWARDVFPPIGVIDDGVVGTVRLTPGAQTSVRSKDSIFPITTGARWDVSQIKGEEKRSSIRKIFFNDQLQFQNTQQMTATESDHRFDLMQRLLGPTAGRIESELLTPLIDRTFAIMLRAGAFPPTPESIVMNSEGGDIQIDVEYEGPLARAQRLRDLTAFQRFQEGISGLVEREPSLMDLIDGDEAVKTIADVVGVPKRILRDPREVARIRAERAQRAQEEAKKQDVERQAEAAGKAAPALKIASEQGLLGPAPGPEGEGGFGESPGIGEDMATPGGDEEF